MREEINRIAVEIGMDPTKYESLSDQHWVVEVERQAEIREFHDLLPRLANLKKDVVDPLFSKE